MKDQFEGRQRVDRSDVYSAYREWPALARQGLAVDAPFSGGAYSRVVFLGMGGSASAGDIISGWLFVRGGREAPVYKGSLPGGDMRGTLALACSASGGTLETIGMAKSAMLRGADVVVVSGGGELKELAEASRVPFVGLPTVRAPRYGTPAMLFACVRIVDAALGLSAGVEAEKAAEALGPEWKRLSADVPASRNPAKSLALAFRESTPKVYGTRVTRGVGVRFCNSVNENAKTHAFFEEVPEAMHNDVETWESPDPRFVPVLLRCSADDPKLSTRMRWFGAAIKQRGADPVTVEGSGPSPLAELVTMAYKLDMASYYLAVLRRVDPLPTGLLTKLRQRLGSK